MAELLYQGHGSYRITSAAGTVLFVDPYVGTGYDTPADLVLITHEHDDHNHAELITLKKDGRIFRARDVLSGGVYKTVTFKDITFQAVPAENRNHPVDSCVGFLVTVDGKRIYCSGDTSTVPYMKELGKNPPDWALLPTDGVYNMGPEEASACAKTIGAAHTIPIHTKPGKLFDRSVAERFACPGRVIVEPGETIAL